jgi:hypothetical protein
MELWMDTEASKIGRISKGVEDFSVKLVFQVDVALGFIGKPKVNHKITNVLGFNYSRYHFLLQRWYFLEGESPARELPVVDQLSLLSPYTAWKCGG